MRTPEILSQLRPELLALGAALLVILIDLVQGRGSRRWLGWLSGLLALALVVVLAQEWGRLERPVLLSGGVIALDRLGLIFKVIFLLGAGVASVGSVDFAAQRFRHVGEYYGLLFFSALGMMLMASAGDLLTLYLGLELATLSLYVLASYAKTSPRSGEAGLKYIVLGATSSAVYLYGTSLIYGSAGTTLFSTIGQEIAREGLSAGMALGSLFVLAAFAFKVVAVPFHMWAPDVYQGAPTPVTGFLSTASKAAGFAALMRVFLGPLLEAASSWMVFVLALSGLSMIVGNLLALSQRDIKRMLAYSGVAQAGYALVGVAAASAHLRLALWAILFFLFQYLFTNLGAFLIATIVGSAAGDDQITSYHGLSRRNPGLALALLLLLLSLGGIPPLSGFWGKLFLFWAAIRSGLYGLVLIGVLASVLSLYYYLMVARAMYIEPAGERPSIRLQAPAMTAVVVCVLMVVGLAYPQPIIGLVEQAAAVLF
jgi:NADH-quinone oxidoreductase subunit N